MLPVLTMSPFSGLTDDRQAEADDLIQATIGWAEMRPDIRALAIVGSWARKSATMTSDVDLVVLTVDVDRYVSTDDWWSFLGPAEPIRTTRWGVLVERRIGLPSGLEVEFGIASLSWAGTDPPDPGVQAVVRDGLRILYDPDDLLVSLVGTSER